MSWNNCGQRVEVELVDQHHVGPIGTGGGVGTLELLVISRLDSRTALAG
jgi:hypothetical protein